VGQTDKARHFADLHVKGTPLLLYNSWDAGSAKAIRDAGAKAIATSSWSVAEAQGYRDGEAIPIGFVERIVGQIAATIDLPVTVDSKVVTTATTTMSWPATSRVCSTSA
jgi:2-methylisocitrate lyase-like PEP mutase family enzyme